LVPGDYSYIDLEDILEEDDEGLGDQLGEGPGKLSTCIYYAPFFSYITNKIYYVFITDEII